MAASGNHRKHHGSDKTEKSHETSGDTHRMNHHEKSSSSHHEKSKNVSHVPCKFFRQSICQAGDKCPFSHDLDNDSPAICKYFQKGNCKFGSKCALAHVTPDGRYVNKRAKDLKKKEMKEDELNSHTTEVPVQANSQLAAQPTSAAIPITPRASKGKKTGSSSSQASDITAVDPSSVEMASQILSKYNATSPIMANSSNISSIVSGVRRISQPGGSQSEGLDVLKNGRSLSGNATRPSITSKESPWNVPGLIDGSAIVDDDDEETLLEDPNAEDDDGFREQLVPSTLEDLLTPSERERRKSRGSQQKSGRVFSSPTSTKAPPSAFMFRRSSVPMTNTGTSIYSPAPIGSSNSSSATNGANGTNAGVNGVGSSGSDLWGPRNLDTPFNRATGFGSPPHTPASMDSGAIFNASINQTPLKYQVAPATKPVPDQRYNGKPLTTSLASPLQSSPLSGQSQQTQNAYPAQFSNHAMDSHVYRPIQPYTKAAIQKT